MATTKRRPSTMTDAHKAALAVGREQGRAVRAYLEALEAHKPKRGRRRTVDKIESRIDDINALLPTVDPVKRVHLVQERLDLTRELNAASSSDDLAALEAGFIRVALSYSASKGISYVAWREIGVPAAVLARAGLPRR
jgi:hypothetical protein